jgi:hypothetical protein
MKIISVALLGAAVYAFPWKSGTGSFVTYGLSAFFATGAVVLFLGSK